MDEKKQIDINKLFYSNSDDYTREYYDSLLIEPRYIGSGLASTEVEYFGKKFSSPIMIAPMGVERANPVGAVGIAKAAVETNTLFWGTHLSDDDTAAIVAQGAALVTCSKPLADHELIRTRIKKAADAGATAFFIDIDHLFSPRTGSWDNFANRGGEPDAFGGDAGKQTVEDLSSYANCSELPIIIKGVLSARDALACKEAGIAAIVASHHHGQVLYSVPPALAVQNIRKAVGRDYTVFLDCGIRSGIDAFKALALGADGVLVGRQLLPEFANSGSEGVVNKLNALTRELRHTMNQTGSPDVRNIDPSCLIRKTF